MGYKHVTDDYIVKTLRPNVWDFKTDKFDMPIIEKFSIDELDFENLQPINVENLTTKTNNKNKIVFMFEYDDVLNKYWNNPLKYISKFSSCMAVCTPDFSIYSRNIMNENEAKHNVFKNRWIGAVWQKYNIKVIPTISWQGEDTYDYCFSGIEKGSIVLISTIGVEDNFSVFINGFNEMKKRIEPSLIIVYGKMYHEMTGTFVNVLYTDIFNEQGKPIQLRLFPKYTIFTRKEVL